MIRALALAALLLAPAVAGAHGRSTSTSSWELGAAEASVLVRVQIADLQRAGARDPEAYLVERVALEGCEPAGPVAQLPTPDPTHRAYAWRLRCGEPVPRALRIEPFFEAIPGHLHLARIERPGGATEERVFVLGATRHALSERSPGAGFADYLALGVEHIATGFDHLVFLLALLLVGVTLAEVATVVTGFTVAHSVTLALGALGVVEPRQAVIEALIGLSIAVVGLENFARTGLPKEARRILAVGFGLAALAALLGRLALPVSALVGIGLFSLCYLALLERSPRPARLRWFVAFVFGLVHGFGFAGLLGEVGLPPGRLVPALLGFNLGVEIGQLVLVALAWPLLAGALARRRELVAQLGSVPVLAAGIYWFVTRSQA